MVTHSENYFSTQSKILDPNTMKFVVILPLQDDSFPQKNLTAKNETNGIID